MGLWSQVLVLLSDAGQHGHTDLSVLKHSQTSQDAAKTPPRRPRGLQDRPMTPKMTPKAPPRGLMLEPRELLKTNEKTQAFNDFSRIQPLLFTLCLMLIKSGLKISSRSLQERSKMPQDVQRPPTWGQHGPNMGPTWGQHGANMGSKKAPRSVQGGSNCFPEGVTSSDCCPTAHMDPKWTSNGPQTDPKTKPLLGTYSETHSLFFGVCFPGKQQPLLGT